MKRIKRKSETARPPVVSSKPPAEESDGSPGQISELERRALQQLADKYGSRWRTKLYSAHQAQTLTGLLKDLMDRPEAGKLIARVTIIPRSLGPVALSYGPLC